MSSAPYMLRGVGVHRLCSFVLSQDKDQLVKHCGDFFDEKHVGASSSVVALDWSSVHPELLLVAYQSSTSSSVSGAPAVDPMNLNGTTGGVGTADGGSCLIWNLKYRQTAPEYVFTYQVGITTAILTEFHPSLIIGGTRGGQIVLWDCRYVTTSITKDTSSAY